MKRRADKTGAGRLPVDALQPVAGNGLLHRRLFLKSGLVLGSASLALSSAPAAGNSPPARPAWMNAPGAAFTPYGKPSEHEDETVRFPAPNRVLRNNGASWTPLHRLEGMITPNGLHFERHHNGVPRIDPDEHKLLVHGMVERPSFFSMENLSRYPLRSQICFVECGGNSNPGWNKSPSRAEAGYFHGLVSCSEWTGVPLSTILDETGLSKKAAWLIADGADAFAMNVSIPMEKALDDAMLALYQNGERVRPENGYPLRLILPGWEGVLNVKWLRALKATEGPIMARNETARYTELLPSGKARQFTFTMEAKSLITSPSSGMVLKQGPGLYQISGLAWSGRGRIKQVEVSVDGGQTWGLAELQAPVLEKAFTRFRVPWRWNGGPAVLKSRAVDETGYAQPERDQLIAQRGRHGFFHYNAIVAWRVDEDGSVSHTYDETEAELSGDSIGIDAGWD